MMQQQHLQQHSQSTDAKSPPPPPLLQNGSSRRMSSGELRNRPPLAVPPGHAPYVQAQNGSGRINNAIPQFEMARSPPNPPSGKNSAPCKYFTKGNCKFGAKCALAHILPDGRRVNRPNVGLGVGGGNLNLGGRVHPAPYHAQDSALAHSLLSQQHVNGHGPRYSHAFVSQDDLQMLPHGQQHLQPHPQAQHQLSYDISIVDTGLVSDSGSKYGSPPDESRLPMSPIGRTALDAPLPASFDSQGISYMARHGPVAASMPSKFGFEYSRSPTFRSGATPEVLRSLHDTAFGSDSRRQALGSSPPIVTEEGSSSRILHSQRVSRPKMLSASLPRPSLLDAWDDNFSMEEDYLPTTLHDDVLTPQERMRRLSRTEQDLASNSSRDPSGLGIAGSGKVGSPLASSPSRFGALFAKQRQKKEEEAQAALGHVGSPLRESAFGIRSSPGLKPIGSRPSSGDISPFVASPTLQSPMSGISQQLGSTSLHPHSARHSTLTGNRLDRTVSSPVSTSRIDEEEPSDLVFSMEEEESNKRNSTSWKTTSATTSESIQVDSSTTKAHDKKEGKSFLEMETLFGNRS
ncbi:hypothetical protein FQN57_002199 [Myotisia sp. PD_48]|nr:hypothetical protein FQN57_002199 [Myotisia sp. PD_48]